MKLLIVAILSYSTELLREKFNRLKVRPLYKFALVKGGIKIMRRINLEIILMLLVIAFLSPLIALTTTGLILSLSTLPCLKQDEQVHMIFTVALVFALTVCLV